MFLSSKNKLSERDIKKIIPFTIASKTTKYLGVNLTKEMKDLHTENYWYDIDETLKKIEINGKAVCAHGLGLLLLKGPHYPEQSTG